MFSGIVAQKSQGMDFLYGFGASENTQHNFELIFHYRLPKLLDDVRFVSYHLASSHNMTAILNLAYSRFMLFCFYADQHFWF